MLSINLDYLKRTLERRKKQEKEFSEETSGKELNFTFWGGYKLGCLRTEVSLLEDLIDILEEEATFKKKD